MKKRFVALISLVILCFSMIPAAIAACAHTYQWRIVTDATCKKEGLRRQICTKCGAIGNQETIKKHHVYPFNGEYTIRKQPTCQERGYRNRICSVCGKEDRVYIPRVGHSFTVATVPVKATCVQKGLRVYKCVVCDLHDNAHSEDIPINPNNHTKFGYRNGVWVREKGKYLCDKYCKDCGKACGQDYRNKPEE